MKLISLIISLIAIIAILITRADALAMFGWSCLLFVSAVIWMKKP